MSNAPAQGEPPSVANHEDLKSLSRLLSLREDFLTTLLVEPDDWSFVVKAHALLESVVCSLLSLHLRKPTLEEVLAESVEMHARIEMTKALAVTSSVDRRAMRALGALRNQLVHNARNTSFTFAAYFTNKVLRKNFAETFGQGLPDSLGTPAMPRDDFVTKQPKFAVFQTVVRIALYVVTEANKVEADRAVEGLRRAEEAPPEAPSSPPTGTP